YQDALCATRAAVEEGVLPGGGVALLRASSHIGGLIKEAGTASDVDMERRVGMEVVQKALRTPCCAISDNAGVDGVVVAAKLLEDKDFWYGYDAREGEYCDLLAKGVMDPFKVVKAALTDAASVAGLMATSEAAILDMPVYPAGGVPPMPPMGGMGM
ncbi:chaperonin Cpn60/TCP-1 family, partial [Kipferlia bialata]